MTEDQIKQEIDEIKRLIRENRYKKGFHKLGALLEEFDRLDETDTDDQDLANQFEMIQGNFNALHKEKAKGIPVAEEKFIQMNWAILSFLDEVKNIAIEYAKPAEERVANTFVKTPDEVIATNVPVSTSTNPTNTSQADADISLAGGKHKLNFKSLVAILIFVLLLVFGIPYFYCNNPTPVDPVEEPDPGGTTPLDTTKQAEVPKPPLGPDGAALDFEEGSEESKLADFLSDPNRSIPSKVIKIIENTFSKSSSELKSSSHAALDNIVEVLKAYPNARVEIYGYVYEHESGTGNKEVSLDDDRARAVYNYLKDKGIDESRLNFQGEGVSEGKEKIKIQVYPKR